jgi:hypothetical protein
MSSGRFIRATALSLTLVCMVSTAAWAQSVPVVTGVTGTLQSGASLTISGIGFSSKSVAAPLKWDNFEGGTVGSNVGNGWSLDRGGYSSPGSWHPPIYSSNVLRPNSTRSVQARFDDQGHTDCADFEGCQYASNFGITGWSSTPGNIPGLRLPVLYIDAWVNYAPANPEPRNVKLIRVHTNSFDPNLFFNIYCLNDTDGARLAQSSPNTTVVLPSSPWRGASFFLGNWRHIQMYLAESDPAVANGSAVLTVDNVTSVNRVGTWRTRDTSTEYWDTVWFGNYAGHGPLYSCAASPGNTYIYWDDAYVDTTRAHVEIGDAATYIACTHREIQIPTAWSASSITIRANQGSFASLADTYVYVTDRNGVVNATGYRLSSTPGSDLISPSAVQDLRPKTSSP